MSTGKTECLGLNLWELQDDFNHLEFNADNAKLDEVIGALAAGALRVESGSYTGTGSAGTENPNMLTFGIEPVVVFIHRNGQVAPASGNVYGSNVLGVFLKTGSLLGAYYYTSSSTSKGTSIEYAIEGNTMEWYLKTPASFYEPLTAGYQYNEADMVYYYTAIGLKSAEA